MDDFITLISETNPRTDESSNAVFDIKKRGVFCCKKNISQTEFYHAGQLGLEAKYKFETFRENYNGERRLVYRDKEYAVYRTYETDNDMIEIYAAEKEGVTYGQQY